VITRNLTEVLNDPNCYMIMHVSLLTCHVPPILQLIFACHADLLVSSGSFPAMGYEFIDILVCKYDSVIMHPALY